MKRMIHQIKEREGLINNEEESLPTPAMRQEAATTGSCTTNIFSFSITAISLIDFPCSHCLHFSYSSIRKAALFSLMDAQRIKWIGSSSFSSRKSNQQKICVRVGYPKGCERPYILFFFSFSRKTPC